MFFVCVAVMLELEFEYLVDQARVHKAFQDQDQDQAQVKNYFTMDLF